jgi:hypothetical protein
VRLGWLVVPAALAAAGCDEIVVKPFPRGQGQDPNASSVVYPPGPYGVQKGATIDNFKLSGFVDPAVDRVTVVDIQLADFYNPSGQDLYPATSPYGERPKPLALWINVSGVWCGPCQFESEEILPVEVPKYKAIGAEMLLVLADGPTVGEPATISNLSTWTQKFGTTWPSTIDAAYRLPTLLQTQVYPVNIVIDTATMRIVEVVNGVPAEGSGFYDALESLLPQGG